MRERTEPERRDGAHPAGPRLALHPRMAFRRRCLTGCEPPRPVAPSKPIETEIVVDAPLDPVWDATVEWFATRGLPIKNIDKTSGLLATEHVMPSTGTLERSILSRVASIKPAPATESATAPSASAAPSATPPVAPAVSGCTTDAECRGGRVCREGACTTPACAKDVDCPAPQICEGGVCRAPTP